MSPLVYMRGWVGVAVLVASLVACSNPERELRVGGETPYVRCLGAEPPAARSVRLAGTSVRAEGRVLHLEGLRPPLRLAAFAGPAFHAPPTRSDLDALRSARPDLLLVLGDVGDDPATARATLAGLATLPLPTLVLAGGRDTLGRMADAIDAIAQNKERVFDITPMTSIELAGARLVPLAGARDGHYASTEQGCGYGPADMAQRAASLHTSGAHLVAWEHPAEVAEIKPELRGGLFAWPSEPVAAAADAAPASDAPIIVPHLSGPATELADGSRTSPGFALIGLSEGGQLEPIAP